MAYSTVLVAITLTILATVLVGTVAESDFGVLQPRPKFHSTSLLEIQVASRAKVDPAFPVGWTKMICNRAADGFWHTSCDDGIGNANVPDNGGLYEWATGTELAAGTPVYVGRAYSTSPLRTRCKSYNPNNLASLNDIRLGSHQNSRFSAYLNGGTNRCMWYRWISFTNADVPKYQPPTPPGGSVRRPQQVPPLINRRLRFADGVRVATLDDYLACREKYHFQRKLPGGAYVYEWNRERGGDACSDAVNTQNQDLTIIAPP